MFRALASTGRRLYSMSTPSKGSIESSIREKLSSLLQPSSLVIRNDSWQHRHHAAMRDHPAGDGEMETHFTIEVVSDAFNGKATMQRHRMIYSALSTEFSEGLHSVSLKTKTPSEAESMALPSS